MKRQFSDVDDPPLALSPNGSDGTSHNSNGNHAKRRVQEIDSILPRSQQIEPAPASIRSTDAQQLNNAERVNDGRSKPKEYEPADSSCISHSGESIIFCGEINGHSKKMAQEIDSELTKGQQIKLDSVSIRSPDAQVLNKTESVNNVKRTPKEDERAGIPCISISDESVIFCGQTSEMNASQPNSTGIEYSVDVSINSEPLANITESHKLVEQPPNVNPTTTKQNGNTHVKEFNRSMTMRPRKQLSKLEGVDTAGSSRGATDHTGEDKSNSERPDSELDSESSDITSSDEDYFDSKDILHRERTVQSQLAPNENEGQPGRKPELRKEQSSVSADFACLDCPTLCKTKTEFKKHISTHDGYRRYQCSFCEKRFVEKYALDRHERVHTGKKPFKCPTCVESFIRKEQCIVHQRRHTGERPFICEDCGATFISRHGHVKHMKICSGKPSLTCDDCDKTFEEQEHYLQHHRTHIIDAAHVCEFCGWRFVDASRLAAHLRTHKGLRPPYRCLMCRKQFPTADKRNQHCEKHNKEKYESFVIAFSIPVGLSDLERSIIGEKPYVCTFCEEEFADSGTVFKNHLLTHTGGTPYLCLVCKAPFSKRDEMKSHKQQAHRNGDETINTDHIPTNNASDVSTLQELNSINSDLTSGPQCSVTPFENSTTFNEMSSEMGQESIVELNLEHKRNSGAFSSQINEMEAAISEVQQTTSKSRKRIAVSSVRIAQTSSENCSDVLWKADEENMITNDCADNPFSMEEANSAEKLENSSVVSESRTFGIGEGSTGGESYLTQKKNVQDDTEAHTISAKKFKECVAKTSTGRNKASDQTEPFFLDKDETTERFQCVAQEQADHSCFDGPNAEEILQNSSVISESRTAGIDEDLADIQAKEFNSTGSDPYSPNLENILHNTEKKLKKCPEASTGAVDEMGSSSLDKDRIVNAMTDVSPENIEHAPLTNESNASELTVIGRKRYQRSSIGYVVEKNARKNPNILYIVWSEQISLDLAAAVSNYGSNCILIVKNVHSLSMSDVCSLSNSVHLQKTDVGFPAERLYCLDFGQLNLPLNCPNGRPFNSYAKLESKLSKFFRAKGMGVINILRFSNNEDSWSNQLLQQLKEECLITNST